MKGGAVDFLIRPVSGEALLDAIAHALERSGAARRRRLHTDELGDRYASLSPRERQVVALVVGGRLNKHATADLGISEITVKLHRGSAMRKMKADSLPDLVTMAVVLGLTICRGADPSRLNETRRSFDRGYDRGQRLAG